MYYLKCFDPFALHFAAAKSMDEQHDQGDGSAYPGNAKHQRDKSVSERVKFRYPAVSPIAAGKNVNAAADKAKKINAPVREVTAPAIFLIAFIRSPSCVLGITLLSRF